MAKLTKHDQFATKMAGLVSTIKTYNEPAKTFLSHMCNMAMSLVKPGNIQDIIQLFRRSVEMRIRVTSFLADLISENKLWLFEIFLRNFDPVQVLAETEKPIRDRFRQYVFTIPQVNELKNELTEN